MRLPARGCAGGSVYCSIRFSPRYRLVPFLQIFRAVFSWVWRWAFCRIGDFTVEVEFLVAPEDATRMLEHVKAEGVRVSDALLPAEFDVIEDKD